MSRGVLNDVPDDQGGLTMPTDRSEMHRPATVSVAAMFNGDDEVWWYETPDVKTGTGRTDVTGGVVVGDVPQEMWRTYSKALQTLLATRDAMTELLGLDPTEMRFAHACDSYQGESFSSGAMAGARTWWHNCETCGWSKDDHA